MSKRILIDLEKIKDPFSGLGQFCAHLKFYFDKSDLDLDYWIPSSAQKLARLIHFLLPKSEIFHATHQDSKYLPRNKDTKYIITIHDLNAFYTKKNPKKKQQYLNNLQKKIDRASKVVFISNFARAETAKHLEINESKAITIYNGIALGKESQQPQITPNGKFIFSVGTVMPKKNFHVLIGMLKLIDDYKIVIAGTINHSYAQDMLKKIKEEGLQDRFLLVGTIDEKSKLWYYQNASAFVFPSLLEGFGLPVAEAMSLGLPLFISDKTSLPEIGGNDAFYFKSFEPNEMAKVFKEGMSSFSQEQKQRLIERSKMFSWEKAANDYLELYKELL